MMIKKLQSTENSVACVAKTGHDICVLVEVIVQSRTVDIDVGMRLEHLSNALGSRNETHKNDMLCAALFEHRNSI